MKKQIKIWLHSEFSPDIREYSITRRFIFTFIFLVLVSAAFVTYKGFDYVKLKKQSFDTGLLLKKISRQNDEIKEQRSQIQNFAKDINKLKKNLIILSDFEKKVRVIADIKNNGDVMGFLGIGGVSHENMEPDIPLAQKHNNLIREMHQQVRAISINAKKQSENYTELLKLLEKKKNLLASTPSIMPAKGLRTSKFGYRISPFTGQREFHAGLDIANHKGTRVIATANGKISYAGKKMFIGNEVLIDHGHGIVTKYGHLSKILVKAGSRVKRGDVIGLMGTTGRSTGPHVHYEVRLNGIPVNPERYILN